MNTNYLFLFSPFCLGTSYVENVLKIKKRNPEPFGTGLFRAYLTAYFGYFIENIEFSACFLVLHRLFQEYAFSFHFLFAGQTKSFQLQNQYTY